MVKIRMNMKNLIKIGKINKKETLSNESFFFYSISYFVKVLGTVASHGTLAVIIVIIFAFVERLVYVKKFKN